MKIKFRNWCKNDGTGKQICILPLCGFYWNEDSYCLQIGWLNFCMELWFGNVEELI